MELSDYLDSTAADAARIAELARGDLSAPIPPCPGWTLGDLVDHVSRVYRMVSHALTTGVRPNEFAERPEQTSVLDHYEESVAGVMAAFADADPGAMCWNWSVGEQVASFWWRRMAQESAVHRWDAESATGSFTPIDPVVAADGIDEWFDVHVRSDAAEQEMPVPTVEGSFHVHCTDVEGEWWAKLDGRELELDRSHRKGDAVVRGAASDILLVLWGRASIEAVEVIGDDSVLRDWLATPDI